MDPDAGDITRLLPAWAECDTAEQELSSLLEPKLRELAPSALRRMPGLERKLQPDEPALAKRDRGAGCYRWFASVIPAMRASQVDLVFEFRELTSPAFWMGLLRQPS